MAVICKRMGHVSKLGNGSLADVFPSRIVHEGRRLNPCVDEFWKKARNSTSSSEISGSSSTTSGSSMFSVWAAGGASATSSFSGSAEGGSGTELVLAQEQASLKAEEARPPVRFSRFSRFRFGFNFNRFGFRCWLRGRQVRVGCRLGFSGFGFLKTSNTQHFRLLSRHFGCGSAREANEALTGQRFSRVGQEVLFQSGQGGVSKQSVWMASNGRWDGKPTENGVDEREMELRNHPSLLISCCIQGPKSAVAMLTN